MISGLDLYKEGRKTRRGSSPKLIIRNNALISALTGDLFEKNRDDYSWWGRLIENAVGAHLLNHFHELPNSIYYWRHKGLEVDFVIKTPRKIFALEVKSGKPKNPKGLSEFCRVFPKITPVIIGTQGIGFEEFFKTALLFAVFPLNIQYCYNIKSGPLKTKILLICINSENSKI